MIEGTWTLVSGEQDGQQISDEVLQSAKLNIVGEKHTVQLGEDEMAGTHKLDGNRTPMTIDASDTSGPFSGQTLLGIFKLEGDLFTVCFAASGNDRPADFSTKDGKAAILHTWKRV
ncbi:MAG: TIGR03067 domain-containing protein [Planctomycetales bacterium]